MGVLLEATELVFFLEPGASRFVLCLFSKREQLATN